MTNCKDRKQIILAHSLPIISRGIKLTLESDNYDVTSTSGDLNEVLNFCLTVKPDVIIVGCCQGSETIDFIRKCRNRKLCCGIVIIADRHNACDITEAVAAGANSFVLESSSVQELLMAIGAAENNERFVCLRPNVSKGRPVKKDQKKDIWGYFRPVMLPT